MNLLMPDIKFGEWFPQGDEWVLEASWVSVDGTLRSREVHASQPAVGVRHDLIVSGLLDVIKADIRMWGE